MTIGQKLINLRFSGAMSQETLAEKLNVSRQSVSRWEMDQAIPQVDKILLISKIFKISCDDLINDDIEIHKTQTHEKTLSTDIDFERKYFGTDGFRGEVNVNITAEQAFKVGRFLGWYYSNSLSGCKKYGYRPKVILGKDTRRSSYMLEYALSAGLTCSGADVYMLHVTTTPSVSYVTGKEGFDCGIMISASHNPYYDNGIKLVNRYGEKMDNRTLCYIEAYLSGNYDLLGIKDDIPLAVRDNIGAIIDHASGRNRYIAYLISLASHSFKNLRIGIDCANGASWMISPAVFEALGATVYTINSRPDGMNINKDCGSTHIGELQKFVKDNHLDCGFAFDGDADRCIAVDEKGNEVNGDHILYILANRLKEKDNLNGNTVVSTIMSNSGLNKALKNVGINCVQSNVGDQNVYEMMTANEFMLGGEQSGHIIMSKYATTGDGILTAIMLTEEMLDRKQPLSKLASPVIIFPQILKNIRVDNRSEIANNGEILNKIKEINEKFGDNGRILLRESGTEPVIRVMAEGSDEAFCNRAVDNISNMIKNFSK